MAKYIERTETVVLAMNAGAKVIENTKRYHSAIYIKDVFSGHPQKIPYLQAAKVLREVSDSPAADVESVVHGRWVHDGPRFDGGTDWYYCSSCGCSESGVYATKPYCSNCGAKMDGGADNELF